MSKILIKGAKVLGVEGKTINVKKCEFVKSVLGIKNLSFVKDDAMKVTKKKYGTFDVVVATTDVTLDFVNAYREELFPAAAIVSGVSSPRAELWTPRAGPRATGVVLPVDLKRTIDVAIQLQPGLRDVFVVSGASEPAGRFQLGDGGLVAGHVRFGGENPHATKIARVDGRL